jgi:hypothetical protein
VSRGEKLSRAELRLIGINFNVRVAALECNFHLAMEELHSGEILILPWGGLHVKHAVQRGICVPTEHLL